MNILIEGNHSRRSIVNAQIITLITTKEGEHIMWFCNKKAEIERIELTDDCTIYLRGDRDADDRDADKQQI